MAQLVVTLPTCSKVVGSIPIHTFQCMTTFARHVSENWYISMCVNQVSSHHNISSVVLTFRINEFVSI